MRRLHIEELKEISAGSMLTLNINVPDEQDQKVADLMMQLVGNILDVWGLCGQLEIYPDLYNTFEVQSMNFKGYTFTHN